MDIRHVGLPDGSPTSMTVVRPEQFTAGVTPAVVLAHGAGSDRTHPFLVRMQHGLAEAGFACVLFNFPYRERGRKLPDRAPVLEATFRAVIDAVRAAADLRPPWVAIGGRSMGGRMATHLAAAGDAVDALVLLGYPLHPAGKPDRPRREHLARVRVPALFVQGTRDALAEPTLLRAALATMPCATLHEIPEADHAFHVPRRTGRTDAAVWDEIVTVTSRWLASVRR